MDSIALPQSARHGDDELPAAVGIHRAECKVVVSTLVDVLQGM
jgi:hypothetical protein